MYVEWKIVLSKSTAAPYKNKGLIKYFDYVFFDQYFWNG